MNIDEIKQAFPIGTKVLVSRNHIPYSKNIFGKVGEVAGTAGKFVLVDFENLKDILYVYWQDLKKLNSD